MPDESIFGAIPGRLTPPIYRDVELIALLQAADRPGITVEPARCSDADAVRPACLHRDADL